MEGYFINSINGGGEKMYMQYDWLLVDNIFVKFGGVYFAKLLESL